MKLDIVNKITDILLYQQKSSYNPFGQVIGKGEERFTNHMIICFVKKHRIKMIIQYEFLSKQMQRRPASKAPCPRIFNLW